eukprot:CAMPEP_0115506208 /NCGR_PEP_ID=MMETSP0271-20121206/71022_1 /TAXON_ID=71861 /ORGANISM="Scrippsiella trochoidea, Strain CCMP3099" /LENGTH=54 /DNA_ID=CAMNT_0002935621 /DNA_START=66 /DNA_END=226 /DNA_ORIENTATION=-
MTRLTIVAAAATAAAAGLAATRQVAAFLVPTATLAPSEARHLPGTKTEAVPTSG